MTPANLKTTLLIVAILASTITFYNISASIQPISIKKITNSSTSTEIQLGKKGTYYELIEEATRLVGIDLKSCDKTAYKYLLGGRILDLPASLLQTKGIKLFNEASSAIRIGVYTDKGWYELPVRIYDRKFEGPLSVVYHSPNIINNKTRIQIVLPDEMPIRVENLYEKRPDSARGSKLAYLAEVDFNIESIRLNVPIYIFVNYEHPRRADSVNNVEYVNIMDEFKASFKKPGLELLLNNPKVKTTLTHELNIDEKTYINTIKKMFYQPISRDYIITSPSPPWGPIPDGGGGAPEYDVLETRLYLTDPKHYSKIVLTADNGTVTTPVYISDEDYNIYPYTMTSDEYITIAIVEKNMRYVSRTIEVNFLGKTYYYTILGWEVNTITIYYNKILVGGELKNPHNIKITIHNIGSETWILRLSSAFLFDTNNKARQSHMNKNLKIQILPFDINGINWYIPVYNDDYGNDNTLDVSYIFYIQNLPDLAYIMEPMIKSYNITVTVNPSDYMGSKYKLEIQIANKLLSNTIIGPGTYHYRFTDIDLKQYLEHHEPIPVVFHVKFIEPGDEALTRHMEGFYVSGSEALMTIRPCFERHLGTNKYSFTSLYSDDWTRWIGTARREVASGIMGYARCNKMFGLWESPTGTGLANIFIRTDIIGQGEPQSGDTYSNIIFIHVTPTGIDTENSGDPYTYGYREAVINDLIINYHNSWIDQISSIEALKFDPGTGASWPDLSIEGLLGSLGSALFSDIISKIIESASNVFTVVNYFLAGYHYLKHYLTADVTIETDGQHNFKIIYHSPEGTTDPFLFKAEIFASNIPEEYEGKYIYSYVTVKTNIYEKGNYAQSYTLEQTIPIKNYVVR